ncbi:MAG: YggS family pyridoxal phosphate-dependent enzyme, partial [Turicibacter sp.]|nr:YggS family pyridoxal phosphate-dependent enzyme [Turicibacter sp.]
GFKEVNMLELNLGEIRENIERAAAKSGRTAEDIVLLGVTKTVSAEKIEAAAQLGVRCFGENRVQEFLPKYENLQHLGLDWHMIGHLQTNKVKFIVDKVSLIHSVDNVKLAEEIDKRAAAVDRVVDVLVEVNIAEETTKYGIKPHEVENFIDKISHLKNIFLKGMMCIAPILANPEDSRKFFQKMSKIFVDTKSKNLYNVKMEFLSMGMSLDYVQAIEEGANIVRIGTSLFGERQR